MGQPGQPCAPITPGATLAMRVLIADDHEIIRKGISSILQSRADIQICGEATNGEEAVSKTRLLKPDLLILDISLPDSSGWEVATAIKKLLLEIPILFLSAYGGKQLNDEVKKRGFQGFISKNDAAKTLLGAVDAIVHLKQNFYS
jgi:two-component system nitrate/nitrite response regulator NarL